MNSLADWTSGTARLVFEECASCEFRWYFRRDFCPSCGASEPDRSESSGRGTVVAVTAVNQTRSASFDEPSYNIALVDLDDGVRVMGRCAHGVAPSNLVSVSFLDSPVLPYFTAVDPEGVEIS